MSQVETDRPPLALLPSRALIRLTGADVRPFLQGLATQDLTHVATVGEAVFTALLTPQGKIMFDFFLRPIDEGFMLEVDADAAPALLKRLAMYRLRAKVAFDPMPDLAVAVAFPDGAGDALAAIEAPDAAAFADPRLPALGRRIHGPAEILGAAATTSESRWDAHRRAMGVPEFGRDFGSDEVFLLDVNYDALNAVSYRKGCFVGQEVTSRMKRKGEIRKRTLIVEMDGPPAKGAPVTAGEVTLGETMSAGPDGVALAVIRLDKLANAGGEQGSDIRIDGRLARLSRPAYLTD